METIIGSEIHVNISLFKEATGQVKISVVREGCPDKRVRYFAILDITDEFSLLECETMIGRACDGCKELSDFDSSQRLRQCPNEALKWKPGCSNVH